MEGAVPRALAKEQLAALGALDSSRTMHEGWLLKECGLIAGFKAWKPRWCVLVQGEGLYYFRQKRPEEHARGLISLQACLTVARLTVACQ